MKTRLIGFALPIFCAIALSGLGASYFWTGAAAGDGNNYWNAGNWVTGSVNGPVPANPPAYNDHQDQVVFTDHPGLENKKVEGNWAENNTVTFQNSTGWDVDMGFLNYGVSSTGNGTNIIRGWCKTVSFGSWTTVGEGNTLVFAGGFCIDGWQALYLFGTGTAVFHSYPYAAYDWSYILLLDGSLVRVEHAVPVGNVQVQLFNRYSRFQYKNTVKNAEDYIGWDVFVDKYERPGFVLSARDIGDGYVEVYFKPPPYTLVIVK